MIAFIEDSKATYEIEHTALRKEKEKLERQQLKLLNAHYEDMIPSNLFKKEQDRISALMMSIDNQMLLHTDYGKQAKENFDVILDTLEDCNKVYATAPDKIKRAFNQAIFEKILVSSNGDVTPELAEGYGSVVFLKRQIKKESSSMSEFFGISDSMPNTFENFFDVGLNNNKMVGVKGLEPSTSRSQTARASQLRHTPKSVS